jgi:hypothetical protein
MRLALKTMAAVGLLFGALLCHQWWLSVALPRALEQAGVDLDWDRSGAPTSEELIESGVDLRADWLASISINMATSLQINTLFRRNWLWMILLSVAMASVAALVAPRIRTRWSLRTAMVMIASLAVALGGMRLWGMSLVYRSIAQCHEWDESNCHGAYVWNQASPGNERNRRRMAYHSELKRKYQYAAIHPWLPLVPDGPEPD